MHHRRVEYELEFPFEAEWTKPILGFGTGRLLLLVYHLHHSILITVIGVFDVLAVLEVINIVCSDDNRHAPSAPHRVRSKRLEAAHQLRDAWRYNAYHTHMK